jgi:hypothetical protein
MLVSVCAFNIIDPAAAAAPLQPVTADVLELLEEQIAAEAAAEEAKRAVEAEQAVAQAEKGRSQMAAAAVAKALATMGECTWAGSWLAWGGIECTLQLADLFAVAVRKAAECRPSLHQPQLGRLGLLHLDSLLA